MTKPITLKFTALLEETPFSVVAELILGRPAPPCSNPSSPAFSDPGEPDECLIVSVTLEEFTMNFSEVLSETVLMMLSERAWEAYHEQIPSESL